MFLPQTVSTKDGPKVEGASPELLRSLLGAYSHELETQSPAIYESMLPGLPPSQIEDELHAIGIVPIPELVVWWTWKNGHRPLFGHGLAFGQMSLQTAIKIYQSEYLGTDITDWNPEWIRIAGEGNRGPAVRCRKGESAPLVRSASTHDIGTQEFEDTIRQAVSLCTPVTWWLTAIANGWMYFDTTTGFWQRDFDQFPPEWRLTYLM